MNTTTELLLVPNKLHDTLRDLGHGTISEFAKDFGCSRSHVTNTLTKGPRNKPMEKAAYEFIKQKSEDLQQHDEEIMEGLQSLTIRDGLEAA